MNGEIFVGEGNNPFDEFVFKIGRGFENDNIATFGRAHAVGNFIGEEVFAVVEIGFHRGAFYFVRLENKEVKKQKDGNGENDDLDDFK